MHTLFVIIFVCFNSSLYGMEDSREEDYSENYARSLHDEIYRNNVAEIKSLLRAGANVHERENGTTPLHRAAW
ncbi:MAG TPA: ankyrin repeat domain-containing protein, partial [Candidatus Babeliales bacterium]|nr:ankyrin repeat domain-containing protein [Candidatus Babeliales bacterium]